MKTLNKIFHSWIFYAAVAIVIIVVVLLIIYLPRKNSNNSANDNFTCPTASFINCMPAVINNESQRQEAERQARYCQFVGENCPNVQIAF